VPPGAGWSALAERTRAVGSPVIALLASSLLLCCLVSLPDVAIGWPALSTANARLPGWAGLALIVAVSTAALCLVTCTRLGSAAPLALGTTSALLGLALSGDVASGAQAVLVLVLLALGVGALFVSGLCLLEEVSPRLAQVVVIGWVLPWAGGWGALGWLAVHGRPSDETRLGLHPPALILVAGSGVLLLWAVVTLALEPRRELSRDRAGWETAWAMLLVLVVAAGSLVMLVGFQPELSPSWGRPVVLLVTLVVAVGLLLCGTAMPDLATRPAYVPVVASSAVGPVCIQVLVLVSAEASGSLSEWVLVVLAASGAVGVGVGWRWARGALVAGPALMAAACAGGWVMPTNQWLMVASAAPLCLGLAAAVGSGIRLSVSSRMLLRFVAVAGLSGLLLGQLSAAPLGWALGAELTGTSDARAGGRVLLGLTFALTVLVAATCAVLSTRPAARIGTDPDGFGLSEQPFELTFRLDAG
jgi:hypothetical protein